MALFHYFGSTHVEPFTIRTARFGNRELNLVAQVVKVCPHDLHHQGLGDMSMSYSNYKVIIFHNNKC